MLHINKELCWECLKGVERGVEVTDEELPKFEVEWESGWVPCRAGRFYDAKPWLCQWREDGVPEGCPFVAEHAVSQE